MSKQHNDANSNDPKM